MPDPATVPPQLLALPPFWRRALLRTRRWLVRAFSSSLTRRIVTLNLAGLAVLFAGFLWINQTHTGVIDARRQSLLLQAETIAAAIASATYSSGGEGITLDIETLIREQAGDAPARDDPALGFLEFSINPAQVAPILRQLVAPTRTRARLFDPEGAVLVDTRAFFRRVNSGVALTKPPPARLLDWLRSTFGVYRAPYGEAQISENIQPDLANALKGEAVSRVQVVAGNTIVHVLSPVYRGGTLRGALVLSTQEGDVDQVIAEERWNYLLVFLGASLVMLVLSALQARSIADPVRRLSEAADRVRRGTKGRTQIPDFSGRSDEIGRLSHSLGEMTGALYSRIESIERFAADVAHELKNPLTSLRSAAETLPLARTPEIRARLLGIIHHDVRRLDRLITDISEASRLDAELQRQEGTPMDLGALIAGALALKKEVLPEDGPSLAFFNRAPAPVRVIGHEGRLVQVLMNLIDNALSFSAHGQKVTLTLAKSGENAEILVEDSGPGIPEHALKRIFERFYTDRPEQGFGQNSGLGLAISQQIVEAHGGIIFAANREQGGARFTIRLPLMP